MWRPIEVDEMHSLLGMVIQGAGIALLALLSFFLTRSIRRTFLSYWAAAWALLAASLAALFLSFRLPPFAAWIESLYYLGEYAFGFLIVAGIRNYATGRTVGHGDLRLLAAAFVVSQALSRAAPDFALRFMPHSLILAGIFAWAFVQLEAARRARGTTPGTRIMSVALIVLTLDFLHYMPVFAYSYVNRLRLPEAYAAYTSIYDLLFEMLLGFGTVTLVLEDVHRQVEAANLELREARDRLETVARMDPLTASLNRHAFYSLVEGHRTAPSAAPSGCVALVDIDRLKPINDSFGHHAGDAVIRAVAGTIRALVRADDLVFRWGGDEFLVLLFGVCEEEVRRRLEGLAETLRPLSVPGSREPIAVTVSWGVASFSPEGASVEKAIELADQAMYRRKEGARDRAAR